MDAARRMQLIRVIQKVEQNPDFSKKLGIANKSSFKPDHDQKEFQESVGLGGQRR